MTAKVLVFMPGLVNPFYVAVIVTKAEVAKVAYMDAFQKLVGGYFECVPHRDDDGAKWMALINDDAATLNLPPNEAAWEVLKRLGFQGELYFGIVVLCKTNTNPFLEDDDIESMMNSDIVEVDAACADYAKTLRK